MVSAFFLVMVFPSVGFPDPVRIYGGKFDLPLLDPIGPGSAMTEAAIEVPDHFVIADLDVRINITHTNVFDLQLFLQSPAGTKLCLNMYDFDEFFTGANYTDTIFDDEAILSIKDGDAPFTGRFRPEAGYLLESFDGQDTYGSWRLQIYDMWPTDTGTLNSFELMITTPEPASAIFFILAAALMCLHNRRSNLKTTLI
jgi:hypothetical protein